MAIRHRLIKRVILDVHKDGGSILHPPLYLPITHPFYDENPHLDMWQSGSAISRKIGPRELLVGHILRQHKGYRGWIVSKEVEIIRYQATWGVKLPAYYPTKRPKKFKLTDAFQAFNVNRDAIHVGYYPDKNEAELGVIEAYEKQFDTVLPS